MQVLGFKSRSDQHASEQAIHRSIARRKQRSRLCGPGPGLRFQSGVPGSKSMSMLHKQIKLNSHPKSPEFFMFPCLTFKKNYLSTIICSMKRFTMREEKENDSQRARFMVVSSTSRFASV